MELRINLKDGKPIYRQIVDQVQYQVAAGRLQPGEKLSSVRQLATRLLVNPNTVARAYRELEAAGTLEARAGSGVFVRAGGSPLAWREKRRILGERVEGLLVEARQMGVEFDRLVEILHEHRERLSARGGA